MQPFALRFSFFVLAIVFLSACSGTNSLTKPAFTTMEKTPPGSAERVRVFIEGKDRGFTPNTFNVRKGFGERSVILKTNTNKIVRQFEVEQIYTSSASDLSYGFDRSDSGDRVTYDVESLNAKKDGTLIIPDLGNTMIAIEDRRFGLTLNIIE